MYPEDDENWVTGRYKRQDRIVGDYNKSIMSPIVPFPYTTQYRTSLRSHAKDVDEKLVRNCTDRCDGLQGSQFELTYRTERGDDRTEVQVKLDGALQTFSGSEATRQKPPFIRGWVRFSKSGVEGSTKYIP
jgi:hypothetical protein